jgi:hypothetical protein
MPADLDHGGRTLACLVSRVARRLLALAAAIHDNWSIGEPEASSPTTTKESIV